MHALKRALDLVTAGILLVLAAPIVAAVACMLGLTAGRPIIFRQLRPGRGGVPFELLKFRTMRPSETSDGSPESEEARLTRLGRLLRATSLDELPQLWNVLRGDMSLVGPRPLLMEYLPLYSERQARRHEVRPGITGIAQVQGRNAVTWADRLEMDVWYVDHRSLLLDLRILARTVGAVISRRGVSQSGRATMDRFEGQRAQDGDSVVGS